jgi:uncharacterized protein (DUF1800 family)
VYSGTFGKEQAERLLWRAGFGPTHGQAAELAKMGLTGAVQSLTRPPVEQLVGPAPIDEKGRPIDPIDVYGHDHLWWLDRMIRTTTPLVERMTLIWHDWFATSNAGVASQRLMLNQNGTFRQYALASFRQLLLGITEDPAMLVWLNGNQNIASAPNENYGREMMELFTLGADRGAYTETDVRENARALTGWRGGVNKGVIVPFVYDPTRHDPGNKTIFGHTGAYSWQDSCDLCLNHPLHPSFFVNKLWSYFVPTPASAATAKGLEAVYAGRQIRPVVEAILQHPDLYEGPRMVKPPVVYTAGLLRMAGEFIQSSTWWSLDQSAGQQLFYPPDVSGWDDTRWLDTATSRARWFIAATVQGFTTPLNSPSDPEQLVDHAIGFWGNPTITPVTKTLLVKFAKAQLDMNNAPPVVDTAVRRLVASSPDLQTS